VKNKINRGIKLRGSSDGNRLRSSGIIGGSGRSAGITGRSSSWSSRNVGVEGRDAVNLCHFGSKGIGAGVIKASVGMRAIKRYARCRYGKKVLGPNWGGNKRRRIGTSQNWRRIKKVRGISRGLEVTIVGVMSVCDCPDPT
jgi:hypothetical protein